MASSRSLTVAAFMFTASVATLACSAFALDGFSSDDPSSSDASTVDGSTDATSGGDGGADVVVPSGECAPTPGNLLVGQNEGFEQGCSLWQTDRANLSASTVSHCGKQACRVCPWQAEGSALLMATVPKHAGERYVFSVWIRREGETSTIKAIPRIDMRDNTVLQFGSAPLMTEWGVATVTIDVPEGYESDDFRLGVGPNGGFETDSCFLIDDAALVRTKDAGP